MFPTLLTVLLVSLGWDAINITGDEWITPGYTIATIEMIDPLDYTDSIPTTSDVILLQCKMLFVDTPDGEKWRVILRLTDKLVLLQEDSDAVEFDVPEPGAMDLCVSPDGRWSIVTSLPYCLGLNGVDNCTRVLLDLDSGDRYPLETFKDKWEPITVSNNGEVFAVRGLQGEWFLINGVAFYNPRTGYTKEIEGFYHTGVYYVRSDDGSVTLILDEAEDQLIAFDRWGQERWTIPFPEDKRYIDISENGDYVFISTANGVLLIDGGTGMTFCRRFDGVSTRRITLSPDLEFIALQTLEYDSTASVWYPGFATSSSSDWFESYNLIRCDIDREVWDYPEAVSVSDQGRLLFRLRSSHLNGLIRWGQMDATGEVIWYSEICLGTRYASLTHEPDGQCYAWTDWCAMNADGSRVIYGTTTGIRIAEITPVME